MNNYGEMFLKCMIDNNFCDETEKKLEEILNNSTKMGYQKGDILVYRDQHGLDALFYAVYFANIPLLKFLLENKADPNTFYFLNYEKHEYLPDITFLGASPLTLLLALADKTPLEKLNEAFQLLLSYGANPNLSFMDYVFSKNHIYELIVAEIENYHNKSSLISFNARLLDTFKRMYCDVLVAATYLNHKNKFQRNIDVNRGLKIINRLKASNIDIQEFLKLDLVSFVRYKEWFNKADRSYEITDIENNIPIIQAVRNGCYDAVQLLINAGADVNVLGSQNSTPLHNAMWYGFEDIAKLLLDNGANPKAVDKNGFTPVIYGYRRGHNEICERITSYLKKDNKPTLNK